MLLYTMLYIVLAYLMLFAALNNSVCLNNASFFFFFKYFLCQGYELSGEIALKNNHYYYYYMIKVFVGGGITLLFLNIIDSCIISDDTAIVDLSNSIPHYIAEVERFTT